MDREKYEENLREWGKVLEQAGNFGRKESTAEEVFEITVAEVLGVGHYMMMPPEVAVVRDTEDRVWAIPETHGENGGLQGLVSRHNVGPGKKLRLKVKKSVITLYDTKAYPLVPETEPIVL